MWAVAACIAGFALAAVLARQVGASWHDTLVLMAWSGGGAVIAGAAGWAVVRSLKARSLRAQVFVVAIVAVVATSAGVVGAAEAMFISPHDLSALAVVLAAATGVAVGAAVACTETVAAAATTLRGVATRLADDPDQPAGGVHDQAVQPPLPTVGPTLPAGELSRLAAALLDTERRLAEARHRQVTLERDRRELVTAMSHDLRSPLATVRAMAEALEDGVVDDAHTVARYHRVIRIEADRLTRLVDTLFEVSRIASGTLQPDQRRAPVVDLVAHAVDAAASAADAAGRDVRVVADLRASDTVSAPVSEADRVIANLLDNGVRHTAAGSTVTVEVSDSQSGDCLVTVTDRCGGIPAVDLPRVFDIAFRGDAARRRDASGGGLGLPIVKGLVELIGGSISVDNVHGGCAFAVVLPSGGSENEHAARTPTRVRSSVPAGPSPPE